jgi:hypothetical protein
MCLRQLQAHCNSFRSATQRLTLTTSSPHSPLSRWKHHRSSLAVSRASSSQTSIPFDCSVLQLTARSCYSYRALFQLLATPHLSAYVLTFVSPVKSDRSRTSRPLHVHFQTQTISEVRLIEVSPGKRSTWCSGRTPHNLRPHIPGTKFWDFYANVSAERKAS